MFQKLMWQILCACLGSASPIAIDALKKAVIDFRDKAAKTDNPVDDILAAILCGMLGID